MSNLKMWKEFRAFEIDVEPGWELCLGRNVKIPVVKGHYYGMFGDGFEIRKDKNFICERPLYMIMDDPQHGLLELWSAKQKIYSRDDVVGYLPNGLLSLIYKKPKDKDDSDYEDDCDSESDSDDGSGNEDQGSHAMGSFTYLGVEIGFPVQKKRDVYDPSLEEEDVDLIEKYESDYEFAYIKVPTANCEDVRMRDSMFLGPKIPAGVRLTLKEVMPNDLYTVHDEKNGDMYGYFIHLSKCISGPDFEQFHSDEGHYEVSVVQNADHNSVDFIALLGNQNELNYYRLDRLEGRVDIDDLPWFDKHVRRFTDCVEWGPDRYPNNKFCGSSCSGGLSPGIYAIVPTSRKNMNGETRLCESTTGVDSYGRKYKFPDKAFKVMRIKNDHNLKRYKDYLIDVPQGGHISTSGVGNVTIWFKDPEEKKKKHWEFDDSPIFRMYTDIRYAIYYSGDWSDYDADPEKTIAKYEAARKKAHEGFYKLPLKEQCCKACDSNPIHRRCPKELIV